MPRPPWVSDFLIVIIFAMILAILSVVNIRTLRESYDQTEKLQAVLEDTHESVERLQSVNQLLDCLDPTTKCGMKLAEQQAEEREFLTDTMRNQAICTLLTSRTMRGENNMAQLERVYNECVMARAKPPPHPTESPLGKK